MVDGGLVTYLEFERLALFGSNQRILGTDLGGGGLSHKKATDFRCWTFLEVAILGADQKERGL